MINKEQIKLKTFRVNILVPTCDSVSEAEVVDSSLVLVFRRSEEILPLGRLRLVLVVFALLAVTTGAGEEAASPFTVAGVVDSNPVDPFRNCPTSLEVDWLELESS